MSMCEGLSFVLRGQEVGQIGPIDVSVGHVRKTPHPLGLHEWTELSFDDIDEIIAIKDNDSDKEDLRMHLKWLTSHPLFDENSCLVLECHLTIS